MTICRRCETKIVPGQEDDRVRRPAHFNPFVCIAALRERAERAEARVKELEDFLSAYRDVDVSTPAPAAGEKAAP